MKRWSPITLFFSNHLTALIKLVTTTYKSVGIGGTMKFILEIIENDGRETIIPIHPEDYQLVKFSQFQLTKNSLDSKDSFRRFIEDQIALGRLVCKSFEIHDLQDWRAKKHDFYSRNEIRAPKYGFFAYFVEGRLITRRRDAALKRKNQLIIKARTS